MANICPIKTGVINGIKTRYAAIAPIGSARPENKDIRNAFFLFLVTW